MKKVAKKIIEKSQKKEDKFDVLARLVKDGFERVDKRFDEIEVRLEKHDVRFDLTDSQLFSINHELKEHTHRLDRIERKQTGALVTLDETIHRSEFAVLSKRVDSLEKKSGRK